MPTLTGNETSYILGNDSTGQPAATTYPVKTSHIAGSGTRVTANTTNFVSTTTLSALAGLAVSLLANTTYTVEAELPITSGASGGIQLALNTSDTLTLASMNISGTFSAPNSQSLTNTTVTTLGAGIGFTSSVVLAELVGALVTATAGTLVLQASQNASNGTTTAVLPNGFFRVNKVT